MTPELKAQSQSHNYLRKLISLHILLFMAGWLAWWQLSQNFLAYIIFFSLGLSASVSVWILLNPGDGVLRFFTSSLMCALLFICTAFLSGICIQTYLVATGNSGDLRTLSFFLMILPATVLATIPFFICLVLPMVLLGWIPCKTSNQTLIAPEEQLDSQPIVTIRTYLTITVFVAVVMAVLARTMQASGITMQNLTKNTETNLQFVRYVLVLVVTFHLTWAYSYLQWAVGRSKRFSSLLRVLSGIGLLLAQSAFWMMVAHLLPFKDPISGESSEKLQRGEVFLTAMTFGVALSLSPMAAFWVLRNNGFRFCHRGKAIELKSFDK